LNYILNVTLLQKDIASKKLEEYIFKNLVTILPLLFIMKVEKIPMLGGVYKSLSRMTINLVVLGAIALIVGILIPFYPQILNVLVASTLILTSFILFNIAYHVHSYKKKIDHTLNK